MDGSVRWSGPSDICWNACDFYDSGLLLYNWCWPNGSVNTGLVYSQW
jgi:hypothetical protein